MRKQLPMKMGSLAQQWEINNQVLMQREQVGLCQRSGRLQIQVRGKPATSNQCRISKNCHICRIILNVHIWSFYLWHKVSDIDQTCQTLVVCQFHCVSREPCIKSNGTPESARPCSSQLNWKKRPFPRKKQIWIFHRDSALSSIALTLSRTNFWKFCSASPLTFTSPR